MEKNAAKYVLQWDSHSKHTSKGLCMLMERQCLVDVAICCGGHTMHAHKCVLAANSNYFKENFENKAVEQVIISGLDFVVMKSIIEFMYCGETVIIEEHMKYLVAAVKLFQITALENVFAESQYNNVTEDEIIIPSPQFTCKPPKYPTVYKPFNNTAPPHNYPLANHFNSHKLKRKCLGTEAEKACAKEAQASRIALANLRKVMASTPQVHSFIVEDSFNETTVENFIPTVEDNYVENIQDVQFVHQKLPQVPTSSKTLNMIPLAMSNGNERLTADKIKHILGNDDVEIMFQTSDGNYVDVSDEVLLNLSKGGLQYQVVDENGQVGEVHELKSLTNENSTNKPQSTENNAVHITEIEKGNIDPLTTKNSMITLQDYSRANVNDYIKDNSHFTKNSMDPLPLASTFGNGLYEEGFNMQNAEMFEPENLSMHSALIENTLGFGEIDNKYLPTSRNNNVNRSLQYNKSEDNEINSDMDIEESCIVKSENFNTESMKISPQKKALKFTPDMFFSDLPSDNFMGTRSNIDNQINSIN